MCKLNTTQCILDFLLETLFSQWLRWATWQIRMGEDQVGSDSLMENERTKLFYMSLELENKATNKDVNLANWAALKVTPLVGG